jgi:hypothetical protein
MGGGFQIKLELVDIGRNMSKNISVISLSFLEKRQDDLYKKQGHRSLGAYRKNIVKDPPFPPTDLNLL